MYGGFQISCYALDRLRRIEATKTVVAPTPLGCGNLADGGSYIIMKHLRFRPFGMVSCAFL
jgi:hypothetical protein